MTTTLIIQYHNGHVMIEKKTSIDSFKKAAPFLLDKSKKENGLLKVTEKETGKVILEYPAENTNYKPETRIHNNNPILCVSVDKGPDTKREHLDMTVEEFEANRKEWDALNYGYNAAHNVTGAIHAHREFDYLKVACENGLKIRDKEGQVLHSIRLEQELREQHSQRNGFIKDFFGPIIHMFRKASYL